MRTRELMTLCIFAAASTAGFAQPELIRVAQATEPGALDSDANILGVIRPWTSTSAQALGTVYAYDRPIRNSWNGTLFDPFGGLTNKRSHILFAATAAPSINNCGNAAPGVTMFWVHDRATNTGGGQAKTVVRVRGSSTDPCRPMRDGEESGSYTEPPDNYDFTPIAPGSIDFFAAQIWDPCCTDGYPIAILNGNWSIEASFSDHAADIANPPLEVLVGLQTWAAYSLDVSTVDLRLSVDLAAHFRPVGECESVVWPSRIFQCPNTLVTLNAIKPGTGSFTYAWRRNNVLIPVASNPTAASPQLVIASLTAATAGNYTCTITSACGASVSNPATVAICDLQGDLNCDNAVTLTDLANLLVNFGLPSGATRATGDIDGDSDVDLTDLAFILRSFGATCG